MTNLNTTVSTVKKILILLAIFVIVVSLISLIWLRFKTADNGSKQVSSEEIEPPKFTKTAFITKQFDTQKLSLPQNTPKTLLAYKSSGGSDFLNKAPSLAQQLGFNQPPTETTDAIVGKKLFYDNQNIYLSIFQNGFSYSNFATQLTGSGRFAGPDELKNTAMSFISNAGIQADVSDEYSTRYYQSSGEFEELVNNPENANIIEIILHYQISGLKVIGQNIDVYARFNKLSELRELVFNQFNPGEESGSYPVITVEEAVKQLVAGKGNLVNAVSPSDYTPIPKQINRVNLQKVYLAYNMPPKNGQTIQPVWVFEGTSTLNGKEAFLTYAVPAINSEFFENIPTQP